MAMAITVAYKSVSGLLGARLDTGLCPILPFFALESTFSGAAATPYRVHTSDV
jgi:hypothetical protein